MHLFVYVDICKMIVPKKLSYCLPNILVNISLLIISDFLFIRRGVMDFKTEFCKLCMVMTVGGVKGKMNSNSVTKFDWVVKIWSIVTNSVFGFLIIYFNPNWEVTPSILDGVFNFYFKIDAFLQLMDIFNCKWKRNLKVNTSTFSSLTFKEWSSLCKL